jgi:hypothetical protein
MCVLAQYRKFTPVMQSVRRSSNYLVVSVEHSREGRGESPVALGVTNAPALFMRAADGS